MNLMQRGYVFPVAWVLLLLVSCSKTDPASEETKKAPAEIKQELAEGEAEPGVEGSAKEAADRFLKALLNMDSPEARKALAETRWRQTMKFPECEGVVTLSGEMFPTDVPGVRGYKRLVRLAIPREGKRPYVKKYVLIAYEDVKQGTWKVFDFVAEAMDPEREAARACEQETPAQNDALATQGRYVHCSYWLLMAGKVAEAEEAAKKANLSYERNAKPDDEAMHYKARADATLEMISRMTGARL